MSKTPPQWWFRAMDELHRKDKIIPQIIAELRSRKDLIKVLKNYKQSFIEWASKERLSFEPDIDEEVKTFFKFEYYKERIERKNVKEWYRIINAIFKRDDYTCFYCRQVGGKLECDHKLPVSKGGTNDFKNLVTACRKCNRQKKDKTVKEFKKWRDRING